MGKKKSFAQLMAKSDIPVLVDFHATWCGPCHTMSPIIQDIARDFSGKVKVIKIDVDRNQGVAMKYGIRGVPTLILFNKGELSISLFPLSIFVTSIIILILVNTKIVIIIE